MSQIALWCRRSFDLTGQDRLEYLLVSRILVTNMNTAAEDSIPISDNLMYTESDERVNPDHPRVCLNCDTSLTDIYCPKCGQKDLARRQTLGELAINFISSFWSFESKFFLTGSLLLFNLGKLSHEYNEGKRERFYHPARMYVFISFVYFLLLASLPDSDYGIMSKVKFHGKPKPLSETISVTGIPANFALYDSAERVKPPGERDGIAKYWFNKKIYSLREKYNGAPENFKNDIVAGFVGNIPQVFFLLLPIFAVVLRMIYFRHDLFYSEHLVFSIYYYNFFFLAGSLYLLLNIIPWVGQFSWLIILWIPLYLLFAMKGLYKQSWGKTIRNYCAFVFIFSFLILAGLLINLAITLVAL
jgi:uncharacterized Zn-finger protein